MKTVVVTGSARGFGFELVKKFRMKDYNVVVCDISSDNLKVCVEKLNTISSKGEIYSYVVDITDDISVSNMIDDLLKKTTIDIWINNAGVNQPNKAIWELDRKTIDRLIDIDLKGTILCSKLIAPVMIKQNSGQIFNVEGYGSNDAKMLGLSIYGTSKRAVTYFTEALAKEIDTIDVNVCVGKISPGIMITDFISTSMGNGEKIELDDKTKKVYNILGDYPDTIAKYMVDKIDKNKKNNVKFNWLPNRKATWRFMTSWMNKRDFFNNK